MQFELALSTTIGTIPIAIQLGKLDQHDVTLLACFCGWVGGRCGREERRSKWPCQEPGSAFRRQGLNRNYENEKPPGPHCIAPRRSSLLRQSLVCAGPSFRSNATIISAGISRIAAGK